MSELVVAVDVDSRWVPLSVDGDIDAESLVTAREVLRIRGLDAPDQDDVERIAEMLAGLSRRAQAAADETTALAAAHVLMPDEEPLPVAVATLRVVGGVDSLDEGVEALIAPADQRRGDPVVSTVQTRSGTAARVTQALVAPDSSVTGWAGYAWHVDGSDHLLVLSVMFLDLVEAGRWTDAFDDLAQLVRVWIED